MRNRHLRLLRAHHDKGLTLVELMIVVAIVGILAAIAGVAFNNQLQRSKIARLEQYATDVKRGLEDFRARHNTYFPIGGGNATFAGQPDNFKNLLGFTEQPVPGVQINISSGANTSTTCSGLNIEGVDACALLGTPPPNVWYVIEVAQDMGAGKKAVVILTSGMTSPMIAREE
jgi:prepilin-type N-terminal cleavage/methylation domain-containing protein